MKIEKPPSKARFKIRVFDLKTQKNKSFSIYETRTDFTLDKIITKLKKEIKKW